MTTYFKDVISGRVTKVTPKPFNQEAFDARLALHSAELGEIDTRATRLAMEQGWTRAEYRAAKHRTIDAWRNRALDVLLEEGRTFTAFTTEYVRPVT